METIQRLLCLGVLGTLLLPAPVVPASSGAADAFQVYPLPPSGHADGLPGASVGFTDSAGETSIGADPATGDALFRLQAMTVRAHWDDAAPAQVTWTDVTPPGSETTLDPLLWVDPATGRVFTGGDAGAGGAFAWSDDGATWAWTAPPSAPSFDHPTLGGGPWPAQPALPRLYPHALYYCAQGLELAQCSRSDDGGVTWGAPVPLRSSACAAIHGHVAVGPDGAAYVPVRSCGATSGLWTSLDGGLTWSAGGVPGTTPTNGDPALAVDAGGRLYLVASRDGVPVVTTSDTHGASWSAPVDLGAIVGVRNAELPMATAGDAGRAAVAFYGTSTPGPDQSAAFNGTWDLYVAETLDGGLTWTVRDLTPGDPVQRGWICLAGLACADHRNLLDFQGMTHDAAGRILVGYADGCVDVCAAPSGSAAQSDRSVATLARQQAGVGLVAAGDGALPPLLGADVSTLAGPDGTATLQAAPRDGVAPYDVAWDLDGDGATDVHGATVAGVAAPTVGVVVTDATGATVRLAARGGGPAPPLVGWSFDASPGCTDAQGWTSTVTTAAGDLPGGAVGWHLGTYAAASPPCAWAMATGSDLLGVEAFTPPEVVARLDSPCFDLPADAAAATVSFRTLGRVENLTQMRLLAGPCGAPTSLVREWNATDSPFSKDAASAPVTRTGDLTAWLGQRVQVRIQEGLPPSFVTLNFDGWHVDDVRIDLG